MNILLIGGGGREHALAWGLKKSPRVETLWCVPGNVGIEALAHCVALDANDLPAALQFIKEKEINLVVIGPEAPLVSGLADEARKRGVLAFGPGRAAARLEGSKAFAKDFMKRHGIPTADFRVFSQAPEAKAFVNSADWPASFRVLKADGLAAGKGVIVAADKAGVLAAIETAMEKRTFGAAGETVVLEQALEGQELSVMALCAGGRLLPLPPSQDHKRVFNGDQGPNTGGMGAYSPVPAATDAVMARVKTEIFDRFLAGLAADNLDYRGVIYFGLMLTKDGPKVLEFNVRFGDPETQVIVPMVDSDWLELVLATAEARLDEVTVSPTAGAAVCVVMTSKGYPGDYPKGLPITGLDQAEHPDVIVFHAGTKGHGTGQVATAGGRVLGVTALGRDLASARAKAYEAVEKIKFDGAHYRKDIAAKA